MQPISVRAELIQAHIKRLQAKAALRNKPQPRGTVQLELDEEELLFLGLKRRRESAEDSRPAARGSEAPLGETPF